MVTMSTEYSTEFVDLDTMGQPPADQTSGAERLGKRPRIEPSARVLYPRKRAIAACQLCRSRKTKCDNERPSCGSCINVGVECNYQSEKTDLSSFDAATLAIIDRVNHVGSLVEAHGEVLRRLTTQVSIHSPIGAEYESIQGVNDSTFQAEAQSRNGSTIEHAKYLAGITDHEEDAAMSVESLELATLCHGNSEDILEWPIFEGKYQRMEIESLIFEAESSGADNPSLRSTISLKNGEYQGMHEEEVPRLINIFLAQVHTKNPILDPRHLRRLAKGTCENGFGWDADSCLVLFTCALACLASPFGLETLPVSQQSNGSIDNALAHTLNYPAAEKYYVGAKKRIALLDHSVITTQCYFLSGVYEMYSIRPLRAWTSFNRACMTLQLCLRSGTASTQDNASKSVQRRLFWSCLKSECELRMEIHVPSSGLASINPSDVFPSPPSEIQSPRPELGQQADTGTPAEHFDQQQSWFYYLADIAVRRIINRLLNVFYREDELAWLSMPIERMTRIAKEIESQLVQWLSHLPSSVASPNWNGERDGAFDELTYYLHARVYEVRERLYRPFFYIAISTLEDSAHQTAIATFARNCVETCVAYCSNYRYPRHRHHGTWYYTRELFRSGLIILAAVKSQRVELPGHWRSAINEAITGLTYWEREAADLRKAREILEDILHDIDEQQSHQYH